MRSNKKRDSERGFSLLELLATVSIIMIVMAFAVFQIGPTVRRAHVESATTLVQNQLRGARAQAISDRGEYIVTFTTTGTITTTAPNVTGFTPITVQLPSDVAFYVFSSLPNTPDNFAPSGKTVDFDQSGGAGNSLKIRFEPNGSAIDDAGSLNNGAVYIAQSTDLTTQRAVTLLGATSRVRTWRVMVKNGVATGWN